MILINFINICMIVCLQFAKYVVFNWVLESQTVTSLLFVIYDAYILFDQMEKQSALAIQVL